MTQTIPPDEQYGREQTLQWSAGWDGSPGTTAAARDFTAACLARAGRLTGLGIPAETVAKVQLVVSELITNARKYAPGPCLLDLEVSGGVLHITVWDTEPLLPSPLARDATRIGGHGLEIVTAVCRDFRVDRSAGGKRVTARIGLGGQPRSGPSAESGALRP